MHQIVLEMAALGIRRGGLVMFRPAEALKVVQRCREASAVILGLNAFHVGTDYIQPDLGEDLLLDDLNIRDPGACWDAAEAFLRERLERELYFEVVIEKKINL